MVEKREDILRIGYFGSYARGDFGFGSDLDLIVILERSELPILERPVEWDITGLPVPADLLVYTLYEWMSMKERGRFYETVMREAVWVYWKDKDRSIGEQLFGL
jgi:predicted nucleotidyltransferase